MSAEPNSASYERKPCRGTHSPVVEGIKANAEAVIEELAHLTDFGFGYNRESVLWLESHLERLKQTGAFKGPARDKLISVFSSFLGECVVNCYGGEWRKRDGSWGILFRGDDLALPFAAIAAQIDQGKSFGIGSFFDLLPITFIGCLQPQAETRTAFSTHPKS